MADTEEKSVMEKLIEENTSNGEEIIWQDSSKSKVVILKSKFLPELVILTRDGVGVHMAILL